MRAGLHAQRYLGTYSVSSNSMIGRVSVSSRCHVIKFYWSGHRVDKDEVGG